MDRRKQGTRSEVAREYAVSVPGVERDFRAMALVRHARMSHPEGLFGGRGGRILFWLRKNFSTRKKTLAFEIGNLLHRDHSMPP